MKKILTLMIVLLALFLSACSSQMTFDFDYPETVTIEKNVSLSGTHEAYEILTLEDEASIKAFIDELNSWAYSLERGATLAVDTYDYVISFDDETIKIVHFKYFYLDEARTPYLLEKGSLDFIATLNWS